MSHIIQSSNQVQYPNLEWWELNYFLEWSILPIKSQVHNICDYQEKDQNFHKNPYLNKSDKERYDIYQSLENKVNDCYISAQEYKIHMNMLWFDTRVSFKEKHFQGEIKKLSCKTGILLSKVPSVIFFNPYEWLNKIELAYYNDALRSLKYRDKISYRLYEILDKHISVANSKLLACW